MANYVKNFMEWVRQMNTEYYNAPSYIRAYYENDSKYTILVNHHTGKVTKAKCHENDTFNESIGVAIAWARYKGYEIPKQGQIINISKLKYGQKFKIVGMEHHPIAIFIGEHPIDKGWYLFTYKDETIRALPKNTEVLLID